MPFIQFDIPEDVNKILLEEQGKKLIEKSVLYSKEQLIFQIIKEWKKWKSGK